MKCQNCSRDINDKSVNCVYCGYSPEDKASFDVANAIFNECESHTGTEPAGDEPIVDQPKSPFKPRERRAVCVRIGADRILDIVGFGVRPPTGYVYLPEFPQLPDGCTVHGPWADPLSRTINFVVEHPSFAVVPDGAPAPEWPDPLTAKFRVVKVGPEPSRWATGTPENPVIKNDIYRLRQSVGHVSTGEFTLTVANEDAAAMADSDEMYAYLHQGGSVGGTFDLCDLFKLPKVVYGVRLVIDPERRPGIPRLSNGTLSQCINIGG